MAGVSSLPFLKVTVLITLISELSEPWVHNRIFFKIFIIWQRVIPAIFPWKLHGERKAEWQRSINLVFCSPSETTFQVQVIKNSWDYVTRCSPARTEWDRGGRWARAAPAGINGNAPPPPTPGASLCTKRINTPCQTLYGVFQVGSPALSWFPEKEVAREPRSTFETQWEGRSWKQIHMDSRCNFAAHFCEPRFSPLQNSQSYSARIGNSLEMRSWGFKDVQWHPPSPPSPPSWEQGSVASATQCKLHSGHHRPPVCASSLQSTSSLRPGLWSCSPPPSQLNIVWYGKSLDTTFTFYEIITCN